MEILNAILFAMAFLAALFIGFGFGHMVGYSKKNKIKKYEDLPHGYQITINSFSYKDEASVYAYVVYVNNDGSLEKDQEPFVIIMDKSFSENLEIGDKINTNL